MVKPNVVVYISILIISTRFPTGYVEKRTKSGFGF